MLTLVLRLFCLYANINMKLCLQPSFCFFIHPVRIIVDLLKMNVAPQAVFQTLKAMCAGQRVADSCGGESVSVSVTAAPAETRGQCLTAAL